MSRRTATADAPELPTAAKKAMTAIDKDPGRAWTAVNLAHEAGVSIRTLQEQFHTHVGSSPHRYIREVRLDRARNRLLEAEPHEASVRSIARDLGIAHPGRFAGYYREQFGETPSAALARPPGSTD